MSEDREKKGEPEVEGHKKPHHDVEAHKKPHHDVEAHKRHHDVEAHSYRGQHEEAPDEERTEDSGDDVEAHKFGAAEA
jgi:hypothetical protein